jgi:hypothetical protein
VQASLGASTPRASAGASTGRPPSVGTVASSTNASAAMASSAPPSGTPASSPTQAPITARVPSGQTTVLRQPEVRRTQRGERPKRAANEETVRMGVAPDEGFAERGCAARVVIGRASGPLRTFFGGWRRIGRRARCGTPSALTGEAPVSLRAYLSEHSGRQLRGLAEVRPPLSRAKRPFRYGPSAASTPAGGRPPRIPHGVVAWHPRCRS